MLYEEMLNSYPPAELFEHLPKVGEKYSLSEKSNPRQYRDYVASTPVWREFNRRVKSTAFIETLDTMLRTHHLDLGLSKRYPGARRGGSSFGRTCGEGESREGRFACARASSSRLFLRTAAASPPTPTPNGSSSP